MPDLTSLLSRFLTQLYNGTWVGGTIDYTNNTQIGTLADARLSANVPLLNVANTFTASGSSITVPSASAINFGIRNTTAGAAARASIRIGNDASVGTLTINAYSSTFTTATTAIANGASVVTTGALALGSGADLTLWFGTTLRATLFASGGFSLGDTTDPGATNLRVAGTATLVGGVSGGASKAAGPVTSITVVNGIVTACT